MGWLSAIVMVFRKKDELGSERLFENCSLVHHVGRTKSGLKVGERPNIGEILERFEDILMVIALSERLFVTVGYLSAKSTISN